MLRQPVQPWLRVFGTELHARSHDVVDGIGTGAFAVADIRAYTTQKILRKSLRNYYVRVLRYGDSHPAIGSVEQLTNMQQAQRVPSFMCDRVLLSWYSGSRLIMG